MLYHLPVICSVNQVLTRNRSAFFYAQKSYSQAIRLFEYFRVGSIRFQQCCRVGLLSQTDLIWQSLFWNSEASVNMSKAYVIGNITITNPNGYAQYSARVPALVAAFGGHYRVRGGMATRLDGQASSSRHVVIEFPSREQAQAWYDSVEYQSILPLRRNNSTGNVELVDGILSSPN